MGATIQQLEAKPVMKEFVEKYASKSFLDVRWEIGRIKTTNDMFTEDTQREERQDAHDKTSAVINETIGLAKAKGLLYNAKDISDGYHTFGELYEFRAVLNIKLFKTYAWHARTKGEIWRSKLHSDGSMFDEMFILGWGTEPGKQVTFHYHLDKWDDCDFAETLDKAPEWDGHTPADVLERLRKL